MWFKLLSHSNKIKLTVPMNTECLCGIVEVRQSNLPLWGLIKQETLWGTAAQHDNSNPASQLSPCFLKAPLSIAASDRVRRREQLFLVTPCGHMEGIQMCSYIAADDSISGDFPGIQLVHFIYNQSTFQTQSENQFLSPPPPSCISFWIVALTENANCNQISWIQMSGLKMWDRSNNSHGSAREINGLVELMGMWVWPI